MNTSLRKNVWSGAYIFCFVKKHYLYRNIQDKKLKQLLQNVGNIILKTIRKSDVVTRWEDNKYVIVAVDNGYEQSILIDI